MAAGRNNGLLVLGDSVLKRQFLDTGAHISVLPATGLDARTRQPGPPLLAAMGAPSGLMEHENCTSSSHPTLISGILLLLM